MDGEGCGCLVVVALIIGAIYVIVMIIAAVLSIAVSVFAMVLAVAAICGALYGIYKSALNYVEAFNQVFGERFRI